MSLDTLFAQAIALASASERAAFLDEACQGDAELRREVEKLVRDHFRAGAFLERSPAHLVATVDAPPIPERPGTRIGAYKLLQQIGEGGMGTVFMAEQTQPVHRKVALKVITPGMDSRQVIARFESERQALALMDHVNIARVLDAGATDNGRPYFVMELVHGVPITKYCDDNHLTPRERLELFVPVCQAIQHAHQKGVIHRDVKPSNVLITLYDGKPVPKVIDFGVAKATAQPLTERTVFTQYGTIVGTLEYMSPEQAELSALGVDTRSDIYALGVLLYELLTGSTPLSHKRLKEAAYAEVLRMIKEEEPPKPSTRLSDSGEALASISANRHTEPAKLTKLVKGELDWIVMTCLEKDRNRRYATANGLAMDVQRYLIDETVLACPPSAGYRLRKFVRRNKAVLTLGAMAAALLSLAVGVLAIANYEITAALRDKSHALSEKESALAGKTLALTDRTQAYEELGGAKQETENANRELNIALAALTKEQNETKLALEQERVALYFHRIALGHREWLANNVQRTKVLLDECPAAMRHWEWHYLNRLCQGELLTFTGPLGIMNVASLAYSPDGQRIAAGNSLGDVVISDAGTGKSVMTLRAKGQVFCLAYAQVGRRLASAHATGELKLWDTDTGLNVLTITAHAAPRDVAFSADGKRLASLGRSGPVKIWNAQTGEQVFSLPVLEHRSARGIAYSPDGLLLAAASGPEVKVWDARSGKERHALYDSRFGVYSVAISPDSRRVAAGSYQSAKVFDLKTGQELLTLPNHGGWVRVAFSPDGHHLSTVDGTSKAVQVWDAITGKARVTLRGHTSVLTCQAYSPDGQRLASSDLRGVVKVWDVLRLPDALGLSTGPSANQVHQIAFSSKGNRVAAVVQGPAVHVWDAVTGRLLFRQKASQGLFVALSPDGTSLTAGGEDQTLQIWDVDTARKSLVCVGHRDVCSVVYNPDGTRLASGSKDGTVKVWEAANGEELLSLQGKHQITDLAFSPDGCCLAATTNGGTVSVWHVVTGQEVFARAIRGLHALCVAFSPDGRRLALGTKDSTARIWDAATGHELHSFAGYGGPIRGIAFSPDGARLALAVYDGLAILWDTVNWREALTLRAHNNQCTGVAFSPDGSRLATGGYDGLVKIWNALPVTPVATK